MQVGEGLQERAGELPDEDLELLATAAYMVGHDLAGAIVIAAIVFAGGSLAGLVLLTIVVIVMFVALIIEHRRIQRLGLHAQLEA